MLRVAFELAGNLLLGSLVGGLLVVSLLSGRNLSRSRPGFGNLGAPRGTKRTLFGRSLRLRRLMQRRLWHMSSLFEHLKYVALVGWFLH